MQESRLFKIVYYLLDKGKATAPELAEKFEVLKSAIINHKSVKITYAGSSESVSDRIIHPLKLVFYSSFLSETGRKFTADI